TSTGCGARWPNIRRRSRRAPSASWSASNLDRTNWSRRKNRRGDNEMGWLEGRFEESVVTTTLEQAINWARESSIWPMTFGLGCCAIEMMATGASRYDMDRFGAGAFRATPRQADLMIVAGTVNYKMASRVRRLFNQMPDPKFVIAMGACTCG